MTKDMIPVQAPFPYFGGKSLIAHPVWDALGSPAHYIEPFFGSGAVLLARPSYDPEKMTETVNDKDGYISNAWRAIQFSPDETAKWCDWPVNHADLSARKKTLIKNEDRLLENLINNDTWHDPILAGYWIWAASCWIGHGLTRPSQIPRIGNNGTGVHKIGQIPHLGDNGRGVHKISQRPPLGNNEDRIFNENIYIWFRKLSERLRYVRVVCGDWTRVCGGNWQDKIGNVGIFFDPPYGDKAQRDSSLYHADSMTIAGEVQKWALERGKISSYHIVLAGYYEEHKNLLSEGWTAKKWKAQCGYSSLTKGEKNLNRFKETLFFSPHCLKNELF